MTELQMDKKTSELTSKIFDAIYGSEHGWEGYTVGQMDQFIEKVLWKLRGSRLNDQTLKILCDELYVSLKDVTYWLYASGKIEKNSEVEQLIKRGMSVLTKAEEVQDSQIIPRKGN